MIHAQFILSAASASDFPRTGLPEVAMVGRSNVGKSSLINAFVKQKIARTSAAPGKTRLVNFYLIQPPGPGLQPLYLVDLPGYGYARGGAESVEEFEALTRQYFDPTARPDRRLAGVLHVIDGRHPALDSDARAHEWLQRRGMPIAIVATKMDKLNQAERSRNLAMIERSYDTLILPTSALEHTGIDEAWKTVSSWVHSSAST